MNRSIVVAIVIAVTGLTLTFLSCGRSGRRDIGMDNAVSREGNARTVSIEREVEEARAYEPPDEVTNSADFDPLVFEMLRAEFIRQLEETWNRDTSSAPTGDAGKVTDLTYNSETGMLSWSYVNVGDYDSSGEVGIPDITPIAQNYLALTNDGVGDDALESWIDGDGSGEVGISDITPIAQGYLNYVSEYRILTSSQPSSGFIEVGSPVPFGSTGVFPHTFSVLLPTGTQQYVAVVPVDDHGVQGEISEAIEIQREWHIETVDDSADCGFDSSIVVDSSNRPHIAYVDYTNVILKYAKWNGNLWEIEIVDDDGWVGNGVSLALDQDDYPHISYYDGTNCNLKYAFSDGDTWYASTVDDSYSDDGFGTSIAIDSDGSPCISYEDLENRRVKYAHYSESAWAIANIDASDAGWTSLALDESDQPYISYLYFNPEDFSEDLKCATYSDSQWITETVDENNNYRNNVSIGIDTENRPVICCYSVINEELVYFTNDGTQWTSSVVDSDGSVGYELSMKLDSLGYPHISYTEYVEIEDKPDFNLKYAYFDGSNWITTSVDSVGYVGRASSIALDKHNRPHISYYDDTNNALKYAWFG